VTPVRRDLPAVGGSRVLGVFLLAVLGVAMAIPAIAQTKDDVESADERRQHAYQDLVDANEAVGVAIAELEAIGEELDALNGTIERLESRISDHEDDVTDLEAIAREIVIEAYVNAGTGLITAAMTVTNLQDLVATQVLVENATAIDLAKLSRLSAVNREMERLREDKEAEEAKIEVLLLDQQAKTEALEHARLHADEVFAAAESEYHEVVEEYKAELRRQAEAQAARRRAAAAAAANAGSGSSRTSSGSAGLPPSATAGVVCPVAGNTYFVDTWGAPRSGGRTHKGTDMAAAYGTNLVAMNSGTIRLGWSSLGGRQVYLYADDGNFYYYAHLSGYPGGLGDGQRVDKGQLIGFVGSTGNATANVLHLGMGPNPGVWVNPYPTVRAVC